MAHEALGCMLFRKDSASITFYLAPTVLVAGISLIAAALGGSQALGALVHHLPDLSQAIVSNLHGH